MVGTMEGMVVAFKSTDPEETVTYGALLSFMEGSIADVQALYPGVKW